MLVTFQDVDVDKNMRWSVLQDVDKCMTGCTWCIPLRMRLFAYSVFLVLDKVRHHSLLHALQSILRVLYPQASEKEVAEMMRMVMHKKRVKDNGNLEQQLQELRDIFAVYDDDGSGELDEPEFIEALIAAGEF